MRRSQSRLQYIAIGMALPHPAPISMAAPVSMAALVSIAALVNLAHLFLPPVRQSALESSTNIAKNEADGSGLPVSASFTARI
jgi:hypothetical protein